jgi:hypothetical protein
MQSREDGVNNVTAIELAARQQIHGGGEHAYPASSRHRVKR